LFVCSLIFWLIACLWVQMIWLVSCVTLKAVSVPRVLAMRKSRCNIHVTVDLLGQSWTSLVGHIFHLLFMLISDNYVCECGWAIWMMRVELSPVTYYLWGTNVRATWYLNFFNGFEKNQGMPCSQFGVDWLLLRGRLHSNGGYFF